MKYALNKIDRVETQQYLLLFFLLLSSQSQFKGIQFNLYTFFRFFPSILFFHPLIVLFH